MKYRICVFRHTKWKNAAGVLAAVGLACGVLLTTAASKAPKVIVSDQPIDRTASLPASFAPIVKKVAPSVVNIYSTRKINVRPFGFFGDDMLRRFFGGGSDESDQEPMTRKIEGLGSGIIISEDGYILSNNHVVAGADDIKVGLKDDKTEYDATVVGTDPQTDVAVLKIDAKNLTPITFADSDKVEVGDVVLAVGNPFGVGQTVTRGIVSAMGRGGLDIVDYEDFIQTDAPINPGNSGGALVDIEGRLVGINQSIVSRSGGSQGVGFAVPANLARSIMERIISNGKVERGYLGINIQAVTSDLAQSFNLPDENGVLVGGIRPGTAAAEAGLEPGDVITEFNGKKVSDPRHLRLMVSETLPGTKVSLTVVRDGKEKTVHATLDSLPTELASASPGISNDHENMAGKALDGVELSDLDSQARRQFNIPSQVEGALVTGVRPDSPAQEAGLRPGDVIVEIKDQQNERHPVENADEVYQAVRKAKGDRLVLRVWSSAGGMSGTRFLVLKPDEAK